MARSSWSPSSAARKHLGNRGESRDCTKSGLTPLRKKASASSTAPMSKRTAVVMRFAMASPRLSACITTDSSASPKTWSGWDTRSQQRFSVRRFHELPNAAPAISARAAAFLDHRERTQCAEGLHTAGATGSIPVPPTIQKRQWPERGPSADPASANAITKA